MKKVYLFMVNGVTQRQIIVIFNSCNDCAIFLRCSRQAINQVCNKKRVTVHGMYPTFEYDELKQYCDPDRTQKVYWSDILKKGYKRNVIDKKSTLYDFSWEFLRVYKHMTDTYDHIS